MNMEIVPDADYAWRSAMRRILHLGDGVAPRGIPCREVLHAAPIQWRMDRPVVTTPERKLSLGFATAEAMWILDGRTDLTPLIKHAPSYHRFSDDGKTLFGAYGPPINDQLPYVVRTLREDRDTRQAVLTIWRPSPPRSKDIPCTVAMVFNIRNGHLHQHVFMRSSDAWLGVPYDMFSFSMVGLRVACAYNALVRNDAELTPVRPGAVSISATSSHLYEKDVDRARGIVDGHAGRPVEPVPTNLVLEGNWPTLYHELERVEEGLPPILWRFA